MIAPAGLMWSVVTESPKIASGRAAIAWQQLGKGVDDQVTAALPLLGDEELAQLASRAERAQADFAAGALSNQEITYILIALATAVIILVIVAR